VKELFSTLFWKRIGVVDDFLGVVEDVIGELYGVLEDVRVAVV
jgi:hypothetical protein